MLEAGRSKIVPGSNYGTPKEVYYEDYYDPPCLRRVDEFRAYDDFIFAEDEQHENSVIRSGALWELREKIGGRPADEIIIESHFQLDAFTRFDQGARAIVDADRNLNHGRNEEAIARIFGKRKVGPV